MADDVKTAEQKRAEAQARVAEANKPKQQEAEAKPAQTKSANKPISVKENAEARSKAYATNRWATIKEVDETFDHDPRREVINISIMESGPPEVDAELAKDGNEHGEKYSFQQVGPGVMIGMREGGEFQSTDGFGWKDQADFAAHGSPAGAGATRARDARR
jgi:hypothetical protein